MLSIRDTILKLEKTLNSEIKRRVEANKTLQTTFEGKLDAVQKRLSQVFTGRLDQISETIGTLNERVAVVEREFARERENYVNDLNKNNASVAKDLAMVKDAFDKETASRQE